LLLVACIGVLAAGKIIILQNGIYLPELDKSGMKLA
jgi:hypothetical protein